MKMFDTACVNAFSVEKVQAARGFFNENFLPAAQRQLEVVAATRKEYRENRVLGWFPLASRQFNALWNANGY
jgi:hypothetical protein